MFQTLKNAWSMPELRKKMLYTLFIILIFRFGSCIPVPFIDTTLLSQYFEQASVNGSMLGYLDMFTGGGLSRATIFAMSITPYINASIILQLLTVAIPALERMVKDGGEEGREKIASWTRYLGVLLGLLQGLSYYALLRNGFGGKTMLSNTGALAAVTIIVTFTAGTALIMWMGEHITQKGIGNGISIILFAGIVSRGPSLMRTLANLFQTGTSGIVSGIVMIIVGLAIVVFIVYMSNAERRIPVQYAKRVVGRKMYGGQSTHLPIKVNASGVMPIIFASSILSLPQTISMFWQPESGSVGAHILNLFSQTSVFYIVLYRTADPRICILLCIHPVQPDRDRQQPEEERRLHPGLPSRQADQRLHHQGTRQGHLRWCAVPRCCSTAPADRRRSKLQPEKRSTGRHLGYHRSRRCA